MSRTKTQNKKSNPVKRRPKPKTPDEIVIFELIGC